MYNFSAPLFWFKFIFLAEILIAEALIAYKMKRKSHFVWRVIISVVCLSAFTFAIPVPYFNAIYVSLLFMAIFLPTLVALKYCFDESWGNVVYCGFFAYNEQHIAYQIYNVLCLILQLDGNLYGDTLSGGFNGLTVLAFISPVVVVFLFGWTFSTYQSYKHNNGNFSVRNFKVVIFSVVIILINAVLNAFVVYELPEDTPLFTNIIIIFYNIFSCLLALIMQISVIGQAEAESELKVVENLWRKDKQIYELSKENVDFVNMKCHDLRHRIRNARKRESIDENELREIEHAVDIYDCILKTGNEVLDIVLSEESIFCMKNDIKLLCNIDGAQLDFMQQADLYSMFQNGIHNAVDAVMQIEEKEKRIIRLNIKRVGEMISIHMENYAKDADKIGFSEDGLPVTKQQDKNFHGFGMRSMKKSVEKYGGAISVDIKDGVFNLDLMVPIQKNEVCA